MPIYYLGYQGAQEALQKHAWTAATLSEAGIICLALPATIVGLVVGRLVGMVILKHRLGPENQRMFKTPTPTEMGKGDSEGNQGITKG
jgi:hypothetical protein